MRPKCLSCVNLIVFVLGFAASASGQELAGTFDQLRVLVKPGDTLTITDTTGHKVQGKLSELTTSALVLDGRRQFQQGDIDTVEKRGADSLKNGALIGFGIGGGLAAILAGSAALADDGGAWYLIAVPVYAGVGAGIGVGIDALVEGRRVIYARSKSIVSVSPILGRGRKGIMMSLRMKR